MADFTHANINFNGDDAIVLKKVPPLWMSLVKSALIRNRIGVADSVSTADNSLSRKSTVVRRKTDTGVFDPSVEWEGYATDTTTGLDSHTYSGGSAKTISVIEAHWPTRIYQIDDPIQLTNGYVRIFYSDGSAETITLTSEMVSGFSSGTTGVKTLTITYQGKTDTLTYESKPLPHPVIC